MGITLDVKPYCQACPAFEAETAKTVIDALDHKDIQTTVFCAKKNICSGLVRYLEKQQKATDDDIKIYEMGGSND